MFKYNTEEWFHSNMTHRSKFVRYLKKIIIYPFRLLVDRCGETPCHSRKLVEMILFIVGHRDKDDIFRYIFHPNDIGPHQSDTIKQLYYYSGYLITSKEDNSHFQLIPLSASDQSGHYPI